MARGRQEKRSRLERSEVRSSQAPRSSQNLCSCTDGGPIGAGASWVPARHDLGRLVGLISSREADGRLSTRLVGTVSTAHPATKPNLAQRASVGYCPRCAKATHVALPAPYTLGEYIALKAEETPMWKQFGPRAPRRLAALHPAKSFGPRPSTRCWAGPSLLMHVPDPPLRAPLREDGLNFHAPASKPQPTEPSVDKKTGIVRLCGDTQVSTLPFTAASEFDPLNASKEEEAKVSGVGIVGPANSHPIDRARTPKSSREVYRRGAPAYAESESEIGTHSKSREDAATTPPTHGPQDNKNAPKCGGHRQSPPSSKVPQSRPGSW